MFKSKLQELCQRRSWDLPEYAAAKDGPDHMPRFTATVNVRGQVFETPGSCKSSKEAQNTAARIAFEYLSSIPPQPSPSVLPNPNVLPPQIQPLAVAADPPPLPLSPLPSSLPDPPLGLLTAKYNADAKSAKEGLLQESGNSAAEAAERPIDYKVTVGSESEDILHMYKNLLQQYAQKENLGFPVYTSEAEGPPHARRFKSKVSVNGKSFETPELFPTMKEAEQTAAKIACQALSVDVIQEDKGLYKNLLQEFAQKKGLMCPSYETVSSGMPHKPIFVSTVEIGFDSFRGAEAKTRKLAEMNAAKVAYSALKKGCPPTSSVMVSSVNSSHFTDDLPLQCNAATEKFQAASSKPTLAGCPAANSAMSTSLDMPSQNILPSTATEKHQVAPDEDDQQNAKRAKSVPEIPETMDVSAPPLHTNPQSDDSIVEKSTRTDSVPGLNCENQSLDQWKTMVFPRKSNYPIPENATVMQYSDDKWVAYRVKVDPKQSAS